MNEIEASFKQIFCEFSIQPLVAECLLNGETIWRKRNVQ